jgi:hypothetical protein
VSQPQYNDFFRAATKTPAPYDYQCRLACGKDADPDKPETLREGTDCQSQLINIPTGLGKTAAK